MATYQFIQRQSMDDIQKVKTTCSRNDLVTIIFPAFSQRLSHGIMRLTFFEQYLDHTTGIETGG